MASAPCCTSRDPPSPEGDSPRPAVSPSKPRKKSIRGPILTSSTVSRFSKPEDAAALQALFDDKSEDEDAEVTPKRGSVTLRMVKSRIQKHLYRESPPAISEHAKADDSDTYSELRITPKKSSNTLNVVKSRLKKHTSRDLSILKQSSEEDIERRAELRRIRHRRIQEELSNEEAYDEDAKSIVGECEAHRISTPVLPSLNRESSMKFEGYNLFPDYEKQQTTLMEGRGYQLASEIGSKSSLLMPRRLSDAQIGCSDGLRHSNSTQSRRHSIPGTSDEAEAFEALKTYQPTRKRSSIAPLPPSPKIQPQRPPSISDSATHRLSWRLSFAAEDRGTHLRKLSEGYTLPIIETSGPDAISPPPMRKWLNSQGLRVPSQAMTLSSDYDLTPVGLSNSRIPSEDFGGVDGHGTDGTSEASELLHLPVAPFNSPVPSEDLRGVDGHGADGTSEASEPLHLHEMGISKLLARDQNSSASSPQPSFWHRRGLSNMSGASRFTHGSRARTMQDGSGSGSGSHPLSETIPPSWGQFLRPKTSSNYVSEGIPESPRSSRFNLFSLLSAKESKVCINDEVILGDGEPPMVPPNTAATSFEHIGNPVLDLPVELSGNRPSTPLSEIGGLADGFELNAINSNRSVAVPGTPRSVATPASSKFREEFEESESSKKSVKRRSMIAARAIAAFQHPHLPHFTKLTKKLTGGNAYDGADDLHPGLSVDTIPGALGVSSEPTPRVGFGYKFPDSSEMIATTPGKNRSPQTGGGVDPFELDSAQSAWHRAVQMHGDETARRLASSMKVPKSKRAPSSAGISLKNLSLKLPRKRKSDKDTAKTEDDSKADDEALKLERIRTIMVERTVTQCIADKPQETSSQHRDSSQEERDRHERMINAWENEMEAVHATAKDKSRDVVPRGRSLRRGRSTGKLPPSWCRYPSHTRHERTQSAGPADKVISHDFATGHIPRHNTELSQQERKQIARLGKETIPARLKRNFRTGFHHLRTGHVDEVHGSRRAASLEYPELEILPSLELRALEGLEMEIRQAVRENSRERRMANTHWSATHHGSLDGTESDKANEEVSNEDLDGPSKVSIHSRISISDPGFYGDCVNEAEEAEVIMEIVCSDSTNGSEMDLITEPLNGHVQEDAHLSPDVPPKSEAHGHVPEDVQLLTQEHHDNINAEFGVFPKDDVDEETVRNRKILSVLSKMFKDPRSVHSGIVDDTSDAVVKLLCESGDLKGFIGSTLDGQCASKNDSEEEGDTRDECRAGEKNKNDDSTRADNHKDPVTVGKNQKTVGFGKFPQYVGMYNVQSMWTPGSIEEVMSRRSTGFDSDACGTEGSRERKVSLGTMALKNSTPDGSARGSRVNLVDGSSDMEEERVGEQLGGGKEKREERGGSGGNWSID